MKELHCLLKKIQPSPSRAMDRLKAEKEKATILQKRLAKGERAGKKSSKKRIVFVDTEVGGSSNLENTASSEDESPTNGGASEKKPDGEDISAAYGEKVNDDVDDCQILSSTPPTLDAKFSTPNYRHSEDSIIIIKMGDFQEIGSFKRPSMM